MRRHRFSCAALLLLVATVGATPDAVAGDVTGADWAVPQAPNSTPDGMQWSKYVGNPILTRSGGWRGTNIGRMCVITQGGTYKMWAGGCCNNRIGYLTSSDGVSWIDHGPVLSSPECTGPFVLFDNGMYRMWFTAIFGDSPTRAAIGYATSPDGVSWAYHGTVINLIPDTSLAYPRVIKDGAGFKMWFWGLDRRTNRNVGILIATSQDGVIWSHPEVVLRPGAAGDFDSKDLAPEDVLKRSGEFQLWYSGTASDNLSRIGYATSPDGINWTKRGLVLEGVPGSPFEDHLGGGCSTILVGNDKVRWWYNSAGSAYDWNISYATSPLPGTPPPPPPANSLNIRAFIDGRSQLILGRETVQWRHLDFAAPGRLDCFGPLECGPPHRDPTLINGKPWFPIWPDLPDCENRFCDCMSDVFRIPPPNVFLPSGSCSLRVVRIEPFIDLIGQPRDSGAVKLIHCSRDSVVIDFDDDVWWCGAWYEIILTSPQNRPPDCSRAAALPAEIWPPDHRLVPVTVNGVVDPDGDPVSITVTGITQDEPINARGDGNTCPDAVIKDGLVQLRAERSGRGNGRVYTISFTAGDDHGGLCDGSVTLCVPHDLRRHSSALSGGVDSPMHPSQAVGEVACIDDGQTFDSQGPCPGQDLNDDDRQDRVTLRTASGRGNEVIIEYSLPAAVDVLVEIYDIAGRRLVTLFYGHQDRGVYQLPWNTASLQPGMYFCRLHAGAVALGKPVLVLK